jgi:hypothetical protein
MRTINWIVAAFLAVVAPPAAFAADARIGEIKSAAVLIVTEN